RHWYQPGEWSSLRPCQCLQQSGAERIRRYSPEFFPRTGLVQYRLDRTEELPHHRTHGPATRSERLQRAEPPQFPESREPDGLWTGDVWQHPANDRAADHALRCVYGITSQRPYSSGYGEVHLLTNRYLRKRGAKRERARPAFRLSHLHNVGRKPRK